MAATNADKIRWMMAGSAINGLAGYVVLTWCSRGAHVAHVVM
jgi:hypothetical protein